MLKIEKMKNVILILFVFYISNVFAQTAAQFVMNGVKKGKQENHREAIIDFSKAIKLNPNVEDYYFYRGDSKSELEDHRGAIVDFNKAIKLDAGFKRAYLYRGYAKCELGRRDQGCLDFSKAGELGSKTAYTAIRKLCN